MTLLALSTGTVGIAQGGSAQARSSADFPDGYPKYPVLAGTTSLMSIGNGGVILRVPGPPKSISLPNPNVSVTLEGGSYFFAGIEDPDGCELIPDDMCVPYKMFGIRKGDGSWAYFAKIFPNNGPDDPPGKLRSELLHFYFLTDGIVRVTASFPELEGEVAVDATGEVDGFMERLDRACLPDCSTVAYGGTRRWVGSVDQMGLAVSLGYGTSFFPDSANVESCLYPDVTGRGSSHPSDHPAGCGELSDPIDTVALAINFPGNTGHVRVKTDAQGWQYIGFLARGHQAEPITRSTFDAWGLWLTPRIECPSLDYEDCTRDPPVG